MEEGFWIEPDGTVHNLNWQMHDEWAREWLEKHSLRPGRAANSAVALSRETKPTPAPPFRAVAARLGAPAGSRLSVWRFGPKARRCIGRSATRCGCRSVEVEVRNAREVRWIGTLTVSEMEGMGCSES